MTPVRQQSILRGMPVQAQKVFEFVPIAEAWGYARILGEITKSTRSGIDRRTVEGCLERLCDAGLIREVGSRAYQRTRIATTTEDKPESEVITPAESIPASRVEPAAVSSPSNAIELLAGLSNRLDRVATDIRAIVSDLETAALQIEEHHAAAGREAQRLRQLRELLKDV